MQLQRARSISKAEFSCSWSRRRHRVRPWTPRASPAHRRETRIKCSRCRYTLFIPGLVSQVPLPCTDSSNSYSADEIRSGRAEREGGGRWFPGACKLKAFFFFPLFSSFFFFFFFFKWCIEAKGYPPRQQTGLKQQSLSDKSDLKPVRGVGTGRAQHVSADRRLWMGMQAVNLFFLIWPFRDIQPSVYQTQLANKCPSQIKFTQFWPENSADDAVSPANGEMYVSQQPRESNITINNIIIVKN